MHMYHYNLYKQVHFCMHADCAANCVPLAIYTGFVNVLFLCVYIDMYILTCAYYIILLLLSSCSCCVIICDCTVCTSDELCKYHYTSYLYRDHTAIYNYKLIG